MTYMLTCRKKETQARNWVYTVTTMKGQKSMAGTLIHGTYVHTAMVCHPGENNQVSKKIAEV